MQLKLKNRNDSEWLPEFTPASELIAKVSPNANAASGYYGVPLLKKPKWRWEIALYFFFEGISAGAFLLASIASLFGRGRHSQLIRAGYYTAFTAMLPCPPLLIADLGQPKRFHHMLRVFKPSSPMNLGAWTLAAYSLPTSFLAARQLLTDGPERRDGVPAPTIAALGLPFSLTMLSYPGVLLGTTSTPIWSKSRLVGALLVTSSVRNAIAACSLQLDGRGRNRESNAHLQQLETAAGVCEAAALTAFVVTTKEAARPLTSGKYKWHFWLGAVGAGLVLPAVLHLSSRSRTSNRVASISSLIGGLALKWAITQAGRESAVDVEATRKNSEAVAGGAQWSA